MYFPQRANKDLHKTLTAGRSANSPYNFRENERSDVSFDSFTGMMSPADRRRLLEEAESMIEEEDERFKDSNHLHAISEDELDEFDHSLYMKNMEATNKERFAKFDRIANFGRKELNYDSTLGDSAQSSPQQSSSWSISFEDAMEDAQILVDVVNGNYTLEDIIGEIPGYEAPNSTLLIQQFHNVFKKNIKNIKTLLKSEGENQYFKDLDLNKIHHMTP